MADTFAKRLFLLGMLAVTWLGAIDAQDANTNAKVVEIIEAYQELLAQELDPSMEDQPAESWNYVSRAINKGFLRFTVDPTDNNLLRGVYFRAMPGSNTTHIVLSQWLVDIWPDYPSMVFSLFSLGVEDAYIFFKDPQAWGVSQINKLDLLLIRIEGYNSAALLIRDRLLPRGYLLSPYESFLLDSYEEDKLASAIMYLERFSSLVAQGLYIATRTFEEKGDADELRDFINSLGEGLLNNRLELPPLSDDATIYPYAVAVHSWLELTPSLISHIHNKNNASPLSFLEVLELEQRYEELREKLETSRIGDMPILIRIHEDIMAGFENEFKL
ncbi:hypothetical protein S1OALGB6SA_1309 [Olavius algarvensis spirochete endosymbiont]|uniref:hypothetical protein n=1 Tax=Olavius algarvensis spirochete endosymbiont TaxID=260710 RepID=UPI000F2B11A0|nr:hypothetical protein [Olavius algarvensis spirochete endosymbiont]VDB00234.1 hypothetical protein S1OALGB6SA_1309 [Olavius algarvensis spirochete endosymbiont]